MPSSLQAVAELPQFIRDSDAAGLSTEHRMAVIDAIAANPVQGDIIRGSGGLRKVRFPGYGQGKRGGFRVITAHFGENVPVYLVALLSKRERGTFTSGEIASFRKLTNEIARYWERRRRRT
jgi:hypothetical protein